MNNSEQESRAPDNSEEDVLLPNPAVAYADEISHRDNMEEILAQSMREFEQAQDIQIEKDILKLTTEHIKSMNSLTQIKTQINRILKLDEENVQINGLIISIIEMFEKKYISNYTVSAKIHTNIFNILSRLRVSCEDLEVLKTIIIV